MSAKNQCSALILLLLVCSHTVFSQCMIYPVSLEKRVKASAVIVLAEVISKDCFTQKENGLIYTRNIIEVKAWLKGNQTDTKLAVLTLGGVDGDRAMIAYPAVQVETGKEYVFFA